MDFDYLYADINYRYLEDVFQTLGTVTTEKPIKFRFSTVEEYYQAIHRPATQAKSTSQDELKVVEWPVYTGDFFPYSSQAYHYWTGYYSSRPNFKRYVRQFTALASASSTLFAVDAIAKGTALENALALKNMLETSSVLMHHDTITGTSPERVIKAAANRAKAHEIANSVALADSML